MTPILQEFLRHGYLFVFIAVLVDQIGLPIPSIPVLLAAGALAGSGKLNLIVAIVVAIGSSLLADFVWYGAGMFRGSQILHLLCTISLEPDSCVQRIKNTFIKHGQGSLIIAKFVPGLGTAGPPLAGALRMNIWRFLVFDSVASILWSVTYIIPSYVFSSGLDRLANYAGQLGGALLAVLLGALAAYVAWKFYRRQAFLRRLRMARINPEELKSMLDSGKDVMIVDLRSPLDYAAHPETIPGALRLNPEKLEEVEPLTLGREIILYCT